jgi:hypothetical protein
MSPVTEKSIPSQCSNLSSCRCIHFRDEPMKETAEQAFASNSPRLFDEVKLQGAEVSHDSVAVRAESLD